MTRRILSVAGARPNFMKVAPIIARLQETEGFQPLLVHTGQHYDPGLSQAFFDDLGLPPPDRHLGVGSASHARQTAAIMERFETVCLELEPDCVLVVGDVNSTLAATLVAAKLLIPVAHVEAGLRSGDRTMPEEINRLVTDRLSDLLLAPSRGAVNNLLAEGVPEARIRFVGNVMIDTLLRFRERAETSTVLERLQVEVDRPYGVVTLHRPRNVDDRERLAGLVATLGEVAARLPLYLPLHPRTRSRLEEFGLEEQARSSANLHLLEPLGYLDFLKLMGGARLVLTDSGGLQEETTALGIPCFTLRPNTERPITISEGTNQLVDTDRQAILQGVDEVLAGRGRAGRLPELWDGQTAGRIVAAVAELLAPAAT